MNNDAFIALAQEAVAIAEKHANNNNSILCLNDAKTCINTGRHYYAITRAADSILHSVGIRHPEGKRAIRLVDVRTVMDKSSVSQSDAERLLNEYDWDVAKAIRSLHIPLHTARLE